MPKTPITPKIDTLTNPIGIHALIWTAEWNTKTALEAVARSKDAGFDLIEIPLLNPEAIETAEVRQSIERHGLDVRCSLGLRFDADISSSDPIIVARGKELLRKALETTYDLGSDYLTGVVYSALGKYNRPPTVEGQIHMQESLAELADKAADLGIGIGMEVVNRYESNLINTASKALDILNILDRPNLTVHLDTYHMHIEEVDLIQPILACGSKLGYVHIGESHRGYLGSGSVTFSQLFRALAVIEYNGPITFESFSSNSIAPELLGTLAVWRELWDDPYDLAIHAREYISSSLVQAQRINRLAEQST
jgi:D-psicose/D-tagatose/L-ribulose 3-epimerase